MRWRSVLAFVLASTLPVAAHSAECVKTFEPIKKTALEGELCASQALNDADRDLNSSYERMIRVTGSGLPLWAAQKHWIDARNRCVATGKDDCLAMTRARASFFDLLAGTESGEHRMGWIGASSGSLGPGGHASERAFYQFAKAASPGEQLFNQAIWQEFMRVRDAVGAVQKDLGGSADRRCLNWVMAGTASMNGSIIRVPIQSFFGCSDPQAVETTSFIEVDLERAVVVR
jgi:uncharacterized protein YecT (DUF1311 family)